MKSYSGGQRTILGDDGNVLILNRNGRYGCILLPIKMYLFQFINFYLKKCGYKECEGIYRQNKNIRIIDETG